MEHFNDGVWHDEFLANVLVVAGRLMFGPVIGIVEFSGSPVESKLVLTFAIT